MLIGIDYQGRTQCTKFGVTKVSSLLTLTLRSTTTYKFIDAVPKVDRTVSSSISTAQSSNAFKLNTPSVSVRSMCSSYTPVEPLNF